MRDVVKQFGFERMFYVLANTVQTQGGDGRVFLSSSPCQEVGGDLDHVMGPIGTVRLLGGLESFQDISSLRLDVRRFEGRNKTQER